MILIKRMVNSMAYYRSKHYGIEASVDAMNRDSADKQLEWLLKENPCFCTDCREGYYKHFSVRILSGYDTDKVTCTKNLSSVRFI